MRSSLRLVVVASVLVGGVVAACSTNSPSGAFDVPQGGTSAAGKGGTGGGTAGTSAAGTTGNSGGAESEAGTGGSGTAGSVDIGGSSSGGDGGSDSCGGDSVEAKPAPLDLFIMLDQSGSMSEIADGTTTKWKAVGLALGTFMTDKRSVGIGAGLQYFPNQIEAPATCTSDASCKGLGTCGMAKVCDKKASGSSSYSICEDDEACLNVGIKGAKCVPFSDVSALASNECLGVECRLDEYGTPDVAITEIPAAIDLFAASLSKHKPSGGTPTGPALQGAVQYATQWAKDHPDHKVAVVLATDGLPTQCQPINKDGIAAFAAAGRPLVDTYVIGVFSKTVDLDLVKANLNAVAQAGAGRDAFLITTGGNAAKDFADAMAEIRTSALPCEFAIPAQSNGSAIDFGKVNVNLTDADKNVTELLYSTDEAGCDPDAGGWYYDADPKAGGTPTQVKLCPSSCQAYRSQVGSTVNTLFGCETKVVVPK